MRLRRHLIGLACTLTLSLAVAGCAQSAQRATVTREALGTSVTIEVFTGSADIESAQARIERAFGAVAAVDQSLNPYSGDSPIARFNTSPYVPATLPTDARQILDGVRTLGVEDSFSPALFGVTNLYRFGDGGSLPAPDQLAAELDAAGTLSVGPDGRAQFAQSSLDGSPSVPPGVHPGLDFGGASKGLAMDRAASVLKGDAALLTCGSSTLAIGAKPDGTPWRVGIEDPREVGTVVAVVSADGTLSVSTSGDYQTYFEKNGVRYHHILDPKNGLPAPGLRSLTVFGRTSGMDADILSTALFVMGRDRALEYAKAHDIGVYLIDDEGTPASWSPRDAGVSLQRKAEPVR